MSNTETITSTLATFFPSNLKSNMGVLASDIAIFYGIVVVLSTYNLIAKKINTGKWIFPLSVGYSPFILIISKGLAYGVGADFPSVVFYNLYYFVGNLYLSPDYLLTNAIMNSFVLGFAIFAIVYITIVLSSIYKQAIMSAATMLVTLVVAPDIFSLFSFGKYLPTYLLTYVYKTNNNIKELLIPTIFTVIGMVLLSLWSSKRSVKIEVAR